MREVWRGIRLGYLVIIAREGYLDKIGGDKFEGKKFGRVNWMWLPFRVILA